MRKVTTGERKAAGRAFIRMYCFTFSIHHQGDDSILVKIHWTPIKSDGCYHWKLKSCQPIIGTNAGPWNGGLRARDGLLGTFLVILVLEISSGHFILSILLAILLASDKICLCKVESTDERQLWCSLGAQWVLLPCDTDGCSPDALPIRISAHSWVITETRTCGMHTCIPIWGRITELHTISWSLQYVHFLTPTLGCRIQCSQALQPP